MKRALLSVVFVLAACPFVATAASVSRHGLEKGNAVVIGNVSGGAGGAHPEFYNGNFAVLEVVNNTTFKYGPLPGNPGTGTGDAGFNPGGMLRIWQVGRWTMENNVIELAVRVLGAGDFGRAIGAFIYAGNNRPQYIVRQAVIRNNIIRQVDNRSDPSKFTRGIQIWGLGLFGVENCLVQGNILRLDNVGNVNTTGDPINPSPIEWLDSGVATFDNRSPDGQLIMGRKLDQPFVTAPEVVTKIRENNEEVTLFALLE